MKLRSLIEEVEIGFCDCVNGTDKLAFDLLYFLTRKNEVGFL